MLLRKNKIITVVIAVLSFMGITSSVSATNEGDWLVKFGAVNVNPNDKSGGLSGAPTVGVAVEDDTQAYATISYMLKENIALELLVATPFTHEIYGTGAVTTKVGEASQLPPTFSVQYHFSPKQSFRPYVGGGINYTTFFSEKPTAPLTSLSLDDSIGLAVQAGFDMDINKDWFFNADIRYINIETTATTNLGTVDVEINPTVISLGVGTKF